MFIFRQKPRVMADWDEDEDDDEDDEDGHDEEGDEVDGDDNGEGAFHDRS